MVCIYCGNRTKVINSRHQRRLNAVWRRRRCIECKSTITTEEVPNYETALVVQRQDGSLEPFLREILLVSLYKSLGHRKSAVKDATALCSTVIALIRQKTAKNPVIAIEELTEHSAACLERFDSVAGSHYRAYHQA